MSRKKIRGRGWHGDRIGHREAALKRREQIYDKYQRVVNMPVSELDEWSKKPCSKKASLSREPVKANIRLLKKPKSKWTNKDAKRANKTISYIARASKIKGGKKVKGCNLTKNKIALKNWGKK